jgi:hypothetical protein
MAAEEVRNCAFPDVKFEDVGREWALPKVWSAMAAEGGNDLRLA